MFKSSGVVITLFGHLGRETVFNNSYVEKSNVSRGKERKLEAKKGKGEKKLTLGFGEMFGWARKEMG